MIEICVWAQVTARIEFGCDPSMSAMMVTRCSLAAFVIALPVGNTPAQEEEEEEGEAGGMESATVSGTSADGVGAATHATASSVSAAVDPSVIVTGKRTPRPPLKLMDSVEAPDSKVS